MIGHPETAVAAEDRLQAQSTLIQTLASLEPEALARAAAAIEDEAPTTGAGTVAPAVPLARSWLAFAGHGERATAPEGARVYTFSYPGTVSFDMVSTAGKRAAKRQADKAVAVLLSVDQPLCAVDGPFPGQPGVLNLEVWLGTSADTTDELEIEHVEPPL